MAISMDELLAAASVIPVLAVKNPDDAEPLAGALARGGLRVVEMTLRTAAAIEVMQRMQAAQPSLIVGMGTLRTADDVTRSVDAGAHFLVSPGLTDDLGAAMLKAGVPALPGVATASEAMSASAAGFEAMKFFPAEQAGGLDYLKSLKGPLPDIRFCPTGSITRDRAADYLATSNVACVGGSWIANAAMIEAGDWDQIEANARFAASLKA